MARNERYGTRVLACVGHPGDKRCHHWFEVHLRDECCEHGAHDHLPSNESRLFQSRQELVAANTMPGVRTRKALEWG